MTTAAAASAPDGPALFYFWAPWCGPCRLLSPLVRDLATTLRAERRITWISVDEEPDQVRAFDVQNVPTLIVLDEGRILARRAGALTPRQFHDFVAEAGFDTLEPAGKAPSPTIL